MHDGVVDVTVHEFWLIFFIALVVLVPLRGPRLRAWAWAGINIVFLRTILLPSHYIMVLVGLVSLYILIQALTVRVWASVAKAVLIALCSGLFLLHKFPVLPWPEPTRMILTAVGFSYVALRIADLLRAVLEKRHPVPGFASMVNYVVPFHMLAAGPIQSYEDYVRQTAKPAPLTTVQTLTYVERIAWGLFKKFVLAFTLQKVFLTGFRLPGWHFVLEAQLFYIWLYLDFSALSDLAIGIGGLLGLATPENFDRPFLARNMINFWERWHISLSQFIRYNLFIPVQLALMRRTSGRFPLWCASVAFVFSFALCGIWHGGTVRFLVWGLLNAAGLIIANLYRHYLHRHLGAKGVKRYLTNKPIRVLATVVTFEFVAFSLAFMQAPL
jgi:alginate O-acetyltransferase complex protein AlgI